MQNQTAERGPRGKYARVICRGCRSRKIKCVMPDHDLGILGIPQPQEKSCERCRNMSLECIVEPTFLGRPAAKRLRGMALHDNGPVISTGSGDQTTLSSVDIKDHLFSDIAVAGPAENGDGRTKSIQRPTKQEIFHSMIEPHYFLSSILAKDQAFGAHMTPIPPFWSASIPELIDNDIAMSLEKALIWHQFFLPSIPGLIELRSRLLSNEFISSSSATKLLFALLCLTALDIDQRSDSLYPYLKPRMRLAVAFLGQEFIFSPPTHYDSVTLCLLLADYKPTALTTTQRVLHRAVKAETFIHLAHRIAHRLEESFEQGGATPRQLCIADGVDFDAGFHKTVQHLQILYYDTFLDGYISKSHNALRQALGKIMPVVDTYEIILKHRQCSPKTIFHMSWAISVCILLDALATLKEKWKNPGTLFAVIQETEKKCGGQLEANNALLDAASNFYKSETIMAARSLLELRFNSVIARIWGLGLLYAAVLKVRSLEGRIKWEDEIESHEAIQISDQVTSSKADVLAGAAEPFAMALTQLGTRYPEMLGTVLDMFIKCTHLKLGGLVLHPPLQHLALEIVTHCKNLVENNLVHLKCFGRLNPNFEKQHELFTCCKQRFEVFLAAPWTSTDASFGNGCVYAACSKIIRGFCELMENLKERFSRQNEREGCQAGQEKQTGPGIFSIDPELSDATFMGSETSTEAWNMWPYLGGFDPLPNPQELYDWIESLNSNAGLDAV